MRPCGAWPIRICVLTLHHRYNPSSASISNVAQPAPSEPYSSMTLSCGFWGLILGKMPNKRNCNWMFLLSLSLTELRGLLGLCAIKREALALRCLTALVRQPGKPGKVITQPLQCLHTNKLNHTDQTKPKWQHQPKPPFCNSEKREKKTKPPVWWLVGYQTNRLNQQKWFRHLLLVNLFYFQCSHKLCLFTISNSIVT